MKSNNNNQKKFYIILSIILALVFTTKAFASLTFTNNAITGTTSSTIDLGAGNNLILQTSGGNVGIGTTNPTSPMSVVGANNTAIADFLASNPGNQAINRFQAVNDLGHTANFDIFGSNFYGITSLRDTATLGAGSTDLMLYTDDSGATGGTHSIRFSPGGYNNIAMTLKSSGNLGIGTSAPSAKLDINSNSFILETAQTPATSGSACTTGMHAWDSGFVYVCVATNTWKRAALTTW